MLYPSSIGPRIPQLFDSILASTATMVVPAASVGTFQSRSQPIFPPSPVLNMSSHALRHSTFHPPVPSMRSTDISPNLTETVANMFQGLIFVASLERSEKIAIARWLSGARTKKAAFKEDHSWKSSLRALREVTFLYQSNKIVPMSRAIDSFVESLEKLEYPYANLSAALFQEVQAKAFFEEASALDMDMNSLDAAGHACCLLAEGESERDITETRERIHRKFKEGRDLLIADANRFQLRAANSWRLAALKELSGNADKSNAFHRSCRGACVGKDFALLARNYGDMASIAEVDEAVRYQLRSTWAYLKTPDYNSASLAFKAATSIFQSNLLMRSSVSNEKLHELNELLQEKMKSHG